MYESMQQCSREISVAKKNAFALCHSRRRQRRAEIHTKCFFLLFPSFLTCIPTTSFRLFLLVSSLPSLLVYIYFFSNYYYTQAHCTSFSVELFQPPHLRSCTTTVKKIYPGCMLFQTVMPTHIHIIKKMSTWEESIRTRVAKNIFTQKNACLKNRIFLKSPALELLSTSKKSWREKRKTEKNIFSATTTTLLIPFCIIATKNSLYFFLHVTA